jgi:aminoglycoside phosphotransferase (APT) family kinase protein
VAGATLRRLHDVPASALSPELRGLVAATEPNRARVALGVELIVAELDGADPSWRERAPELAAQAADLVAGGEPEPAPEERRLVHGDFFRANLIATAAGVQVIDWDRLGCGDPAWDVGFLVAAEPAVPQAARDAAGASYGPLPPRAERRLVRHVRCWEVFWALRAL